MIIGFVTENYGAWLTKLLLFIQYLQVYGKECMKNTWYVILKNF